MLRASYVLTAPPMFTCFAIKSHAFIIYCPMRVALLYRGRQRKRSSDLIYVVRLPPNSTLISPYIAHLSLHGGKWGVSPAMTEV